jgi:penicillin-binding protein 1A
MKQPDGLVSVRIDPRTGKLAQAGDPDAIFEFFHADRAPDALAGAAGKVVEGTIPGGGVPPPSQVTKQLF